MSRYVIKAQAAKPRSWWGDYHDASPVAPVGPPQVFVPDAPTDTGLLDKEGNAIFRLPDPIGFLAGQQDAE